MAWFDTIANAPKIQTEYSVEKDRRSVITLGSNVSIQTQARNITTTEYVYRGLTEAAAEAGADQLADTNTNVRARLANPAGAHTLRVTEVVITDWQDE